MTLHLLLFAFGGGIYLYTVCVSECASEYASLKAKDGICKWMCLHMCNPVPIQVAPSCSKIYNVWSFHGYFRPVEGRSGVVRNLRGNKRTSFAYEYSVSVQIVSILFTQTLILQYGLSLLKLKKMHFINVIMWDKNCGGILCETDMNISSILLWFL